MTRSDRLAVGQVRVLLLVGTHAQQMASGSGPALFCDARRRFSLVTLGR